MLASSKGSLDIKATIEGGFTLKCVCNMIRRYSQLHHTDKFSEHSSFIWSVWPNGWVFLCELAGSGSKCSWSHLNFTWRACFAKGVPWHWSNYRVDIFSETHVDMIRIYSQLHRTDKHSKHSSIILTFLPNGWVFVYEVSGSGLDSSCSHLNFTLRACFDQGYPWHSGNYSVWIHSETRTWHEKNIQSIRPYK